MRRLSIVVLSVTGLFIASFCTSANRRPVRADDNLPVGHKLAFLVGVKTYQHADLKNLDFPENDVEELATVLTADGFETVVLTTTRGNQHDKNRPTAANIRSRLKAILRGATKNDLIIVGLAGHGIQPLGADESYFCPSDANPVVKNDRPIEPERLVAVGEILTQMSDSGIGYKLLLVDACRNDPSARSARHRGVDHVNVSALPSQTGVLLSCSQGEFSFEEKSLTLTDGLKGHGVFFYHVIEGLKGAAKDSKSQVTWDGLGGYVRTEVPDTVQRLFGKEGGEQSPNAIGNLRGAPVALARIIGAPAPLIAPFDKNEAKAMRAAWAKYQQIDEERKNTIGMELVLIPAGRFSMGGAETIDELMKVFPDAKKEWLTAERPVHRVTISQPFYFGKYEVTKGQFKRFVEETSYRTDAEKDGKGGWGYTENKGKAFEQRPSFTWRDWGVEQSDESAVVNVSHNDAIAFCKWLSKKEGKKYRLPTEAEWEYACRAGTTDRYYNGDDPESVTKIGNVADAIAKEKFPNWITVVSSDGWAFTSPVGQFAPNNFGLYDMIGNAWEWCSDWYDEDYYAKSPEKDPQGPSAGSFRVIRGGGWSDHAVYCRSAYRYDYGPAFRDRHSGFRVVRPR